MSETATPLSPAVSKLSPSAIGSWLTCPRQFRFAYVERVPRGEEVSPLLVVGGAVHEALERFFGLPPEARLGENLERALRFAWVKHRKPDSFASRDEETFHGRQALQMLRQFAERFDLDVVPLAREKWVKFLLDGVELYGKVDRIDAGRHGGLDLVDYKTGRHMLDECDLSREPAVQIYTLGAEAVYRRPVERIRFIYLTHGTEVAWEPEREDVELLADRLRSTLGELQADRLFEPRPGPHCGFCPFVCDARDRVQLEELVVDPEEVPF